MNSNAKKYFYRVIAGCVISIVLFLVAAWVQLESRKPRETVKCTPAGGVLCENLFDLSTGSPLITRWAASWMVPTLVIIGTSVFGYSVYWAVKHKELLLNNEGEDPQSEE